MTSQSTLKNEDAPTNGHPLDKRFFLTLEQFVAGKATWAEVEGWTAADAYSYAQIGINLIHAGQLEDAKTIFIGLEALNPLDWYFPYCLAHILRMQGEVDSALECARKAKALSPDRPEPLFVEGICLIQKAAVQEAIAALNRSERLASMAADLTGGYLPEVAKQLAHQLKKQVRSDI